MPVLTAPLLHDLAPTGASVAEATELDEAPSPYRVECAIVSDAITRRKREFYTARRLARDALARAGARPGPITQGPRGEPRWPSGFTGSLTHCDGFVGALAAPVRDLASIGIDAEPNQPLPGGVLRNVASDREAGALTRLAGERPEVSFDRLLFCIKEVTYKVWFPLERTWLGFEDAEVHIDASGGFVSRVASPGSRTGLAQVKGRWTCQSGLLVCAAAVTLEDVRVKGGLLYDP